VNRARCRARVGGGCLSPARLPSAWSAGSLRASHSRSQLRSYSPAQSRQSTYSLSRSSQRRPCQTVGAGRSHAFTDAVRGRIQPRTPCWRSGSIGLVVVRQAEVVVAGFPTARFPPDCLIWPSHANDAQPLLLGFPTPRFHRALHSATAANRPLISHIRFCLSTPRGTKKGQRASAIRGRSRVMRSERLAGI
jgi:hypothetical protein